MRIACDNQTAHAVRILQMRIKLIVTHCNYCCCLLSVVHLMAFGIPRLLRSLLRVTGCLSRSDLDFRSVVGARLTRRAPEVGSQGSHLNQGPRQASRNIWELSGEVAGSFGGMFRQFFGGTRGLIVWLFGCKFTSTPNRCLHWGKRRAEESLEMVFWYFQVSQPVVRPVFLFFLSLAMRCFPEAPLHHGQGAPGDKRLKR